jgi:thymidylate kinase
MTTAPATAPLMPLVLAVEGLCFAGKTTLTRALARHLGVPAAAEYADLTELPPFPPSDQSAARTAISALLAAEARRSRQARACRSELVIYDRSPLTVIGHEHAMRARGVPADPETAAAWFTAASTTGAILTPAAYIYLTVPDDAARQRQQARGHLPEHLVAPDVRDTLTRFYDACFAADPGSVLRADGTTPLTVLTRQAAAFAARLPATAGGMPLPLPGSAPTAPALDAA